MIFTKRDIGKQKRNGDVYISTISSSISSGNSVPIIDGFLPAEKVDDQHYNVNHFVDFLNPTDASKILEITENGIKVHGNILATKEVTAWGDNDGDSEQPGITSLEVIDNLYSTSTESALSANQGRILKDLIDSKTIDLSNYYTKTEIGDLFQPIGDYLTEHQSLANYYTKSECDNKFLTSHQSLANYYTKSEADNKFLTEHQSLADYIKTTEADSKYVTALGTNGNYLTWTKNGSTSNITVPFATASTIATKLATTRKLWGQDFNGSADVSGSLTGVTNINNILEFTTDGIKVNGRIIATDEISAYGDEAGNGGASSSVIENILTKWSDYSNSIKDTWCLSAGLGYDLLNKFNSYYTKTESDSKYQPIGNYLTQHQSLSNYYTKTESDNKFQPIGNYLTQHQSLADYLKITDASNTYVKKIGDTLTGGLTINSNPAITVVRDSGVAYIRFAKSDGTVLGELGSDCDLKYWSNNAWRTVWHSNNDGSGSGLDADLLDGKHSSDFLGVNDNAVSATKLQTARTLWGQSFDGTADVSGDIIGGAGGINIEYGNEINCYYGALYLNHRGSSDKTGYEGKTTGNILALCNGGNFGIGTASPSKKLHVAGDMKLTGSINDILTFTSDGIKVNGKIVATGEVSAYGDGGAGSGNGSTSIIENILTKWSDYNSTNKDSWVLSAGLGYDLYNKFSSYYTKSESDSRFQPIGNYLTSHQSLANYVTTNTSQTISALKTFTTGLKVSGRSIGAGDDEGIVVGRASNNYAGVTLGEPQGLRSTFYLTPSNDVLISYNDGTGGASQTIKHPKTTGTIATQEWVSAKNYLTSHQSLSNYYTKSECDGKFLTSHQSLADYAKLRTGNDFICHTNEFNFVPSNYNNTVWFNYRCGEGTGTVKSYHFGTGSSNVSYAPIVASSIIKNGGTSTQFLKADGSVDSTSYLPSNSNAVSATKLQTSRTLWGRPFDGTANVSGDIIGSAGGINLEFTNELNSYNGALYLNNRGNGTGYNGGTTGNILALCNGGNFGIGNNNPTYKLDVLGSQRIASSVSGGGGDISLELWRGENASWKLLNTGGILKIQNNWTTGKGDYFDCMTLDYNTGNTYIKGNVGIGNTSPANKLDVSGKIKATDIIFGYKYGSNNNAAAFVFDKPGSNYTGIGSKGEANTIRFGACDANGSWVDFAQKWYFHGDVHANGNLGIGTTTPTKKLHVEGDSYVNGDLTLGDGCWFIIDGGRTSTTDNVAFIRTGATLMFGNNAAPALNKYNPLTHAKTTSGYYWGFQQYNNTFGIYISRSDNKCENSTVWNCANGDLKHTGNFTATGEVTAYSSSDRRLKEDITEITDATELINKLNPVSFKWNEKAKELNNSKDDRLNFGLIAQEVAEVIPSLVHNIYDEYESLDYEQLISILIKSNQELSKKLDNEMKRNDELENRLTKIENLLYHE